MGLSKTELTEALRNIVNQYANNTESPDATAVWPLEAVLREALTSDDITARALSAQSSSSANQVPTDEEPRPNGELEELEELTRRCRRLLDQRPEDGRLWDQYGRALEEQGMLESAEDAFKRSLSLENNVAETHLHLGDLLSRQGRSEEASAAYAGYVAAYHSGPVSHSNLVVSHGSARKAEARAGDAPFGSESDARMVSRSRGSPLRSPTPDKVGERARLFREAGLPSPVRDPFDPFAPRAPRPTLPRSAKARRGLALIATRNFLPFAKMTARSFLAFHPEFQAYLLLVDGEAADVAAFDEGRVTLLSDLDFPHAGWHAAKFTASEYSNALKPVFLRHLSTIVESVVYLDSDIAVFSRLTELIELVDVSELVLVPHMLTPLPKPEQFWTRPTRADIFNAGLINAGCFGINLTRIQEFLRFWEEANFAPGSFYVEAGHQTDQQYLNWALVTVPGARILRDSRYNVAYWNLHERNLRHVSTSAGNPEFEVDHRPLGFFHFSGYDVHERLTLSRHDGRHLVYNHPAVAEILNWYSDQILGSPMAGLLNEPYRFNRLPNGFALSRFVREILKKYEPHCHKFDAFTHAGADALCAFLMEPLSATGSLLPLIFAEIYERRPDLRELCPSAHTSMTPDRLWYWFCRHSGDEYPIGFLIDGFRRTLVSDSLVRATQHVKMVLGEDKLQFLGADRGMAGRRLRQAGEAEMADALQEARHEWFFFNELSAAFKIYRNRPDLQSMFPDIFDRDHGAFCDWLTQSAPAAHDLPPGVGEKFRSHSVPESLARIFSHLARREDVARRCQDSLMSDNPEPVLRELIHGADEGVDHDLGDIVVLQQVHQFARHLLVPLYLELPLVRQRGNASRVVEKNLALLADQVRGSDWARRGGDLHAESFDPFEARLEDEIRQAAASKISSPRRVVEFLKVNERIEGALTAPAYHRAIQTAPLDEAAASRLKSRLEEREREPGVNVFGHFCYDIGLGEQSRGLAQAISRLRPVNRVPFWTTHMRQGTELSDLFQRYDYLTDTNVFVSYPHQAEDLLGMMPPEYLAGRRNATYMAWEQKDANPWWKVVYDRYDEIWMISEFAASGFRGMFPGRVRVVPNVLDFDQFPPCEDARRDRLDRERLRFLYVFDANSSMERKNPEGVIEAFTRAFKDADHRARVQLTLKVGSMHRAEHIGRVEQLMRKAAESGLAIEFDGRRLSHVALLRMIAEADCYVSLHRSEGFGRTIAEAMYYGVPVIASAYSANMEYMTSENSFLVPCDEVFVRNGDGPFQPGSMWGEPDVDAAADLMRQAAESPSKFLLVGERGPHTIKEKFSAAAAARTMESFFGRTQSTPPRSDGQAETAPADRDDIPGLMQSGAPRVSQAVPTTSFDLVK